MLIEGRELRQRNLRVALLVFCVALIVRLAVVVWGAQRVPPTADGAFYHVVAQRIAAGEGYTWLWPDGVVTYAAHYPIGYPAVMGVLYVALGASPLWAMLLNALVGALGVLCCYVLGRELLSQFKGPTSADRPAACAGLLLALSPTLLLYTPALMTESCVGAVVMISGWMAHRGSGAAFGKRRFLWMLGAVLGLVTATYLRPQSILLAPAIGWLSARGARPRLMNALGMLLVSICLVLPWTARNCKKMDHCVFVSANGGWNLLIGTFEDGNGAWVGLDGERVPEACRNVYSESGKDACFAKAGRHRIAEAPWQWLSLIPAKLRATFDYSAAGSAHLAEAGALSSSSHRVLMIAEIVWQRLFCGLALIGVASLPGSSWVSRRWRMSLLFLAMAGFLGVGAWFGWVVFVVLGVAHRSFMSRVPGGLGLAVVGATLIVHAVFFGAGRYAVPVWYAVCPVASVGLARLGEILRASVERAQAQS